MPVDRILIIARAFAISAALLLLVPHGQARAEEALPALPSITPAATDFNRLETLTQQAAASIDQAVWDLPALAKRLGNDYLSAFAFVRDNINMHFYPGVLRGPQGTLAARAGNPYDRALLLQALIVEQGYTAQLARGVVAPAKVALLKARPWQNQHAVINDTVTTLTGFAGVVFDRMTARAARDYAALAAPLTDELNASPPDDGMDVDRIHVWVQVNDFGEWIDLDPSLLDAQPGATLAYAEETFQRPPAEDYHRLRITLQAASLAGEGPARVENVLQHTLESAQATRQRIMLFFQPSADSAGFTGALTSRLGHSTRYQPVLMIDGKATAGRALPSLNAGEANTTADFFEVSKGQARLNALVLKVELLRPGRAPVSRATRLYDGNANNGGPSAEKVIDGVPAVFRSLHHLQISNGSTSALEIARSARDLALPALDQPEMAFTLSDLFKPLMASNRTLSFATEYVNVPSLNAAARDVQFYADRPRLYVVSAIPESSADSRTLRVDLLHDDIGWYAKSGTDAGHVSRLRMRYGVLQSALETTFAEIRAGGTMPVRSMSTLSRGSLRRVTESENAPGAPTGLVEDLRSGAVILTSFPKGQTIESWWRFDPANKSLVARLAPTYSGAVTTVLTSTVTGSGAFWGGSVSEAVGETYYLTRDGRLLTKSEILKKLAEIDALDKKTCKGGNEYQVILGCMSIPASISLGWAYIMVALEVAAVAGTVAMITAIAT